MGVEEMDAYQITEEPLERELVLTSGPVDAGRPTWLFLVAVVTVAFVMGTGTGYGIGAVREPSPSPSTTPVPSGTDPGPTPLPTATIGTLAWPWLEERLPATLAGIEPIRESISSFGARSGFSGAMALAGGCAVDPSNVGWAQARWSGWSVEVYSVLGCSAPTLLGAYKGWSEANYWTSMEIAGKAVESTWSGFSTTWLYARLPMLFVVYSDDADPEDAELVEILSGVN
jgi:hypothetical protein